LKGGEVEYLELPWTVSFRPFWWHKQGLQQTASGYGSRLRTEYMLVVPNERPRRVYAVCWSNVASFYVIRKKQKIFLRDGDLQHELDKSKGAKHG
jgi:hypothetical protein